MLLIGSIVSIATHLAFKLDQQPLSLIKEIAFLNPKSLLIVILHMILHSIALIAIIEVKKLSYLLLFLSIIPSTFYILTSEWTNPTRFT